jgi:hypothetical protein
VLLTLGLVTGLYGLFQWKAGPQAFGNWSEDYGRYAQLAWSTKTGVVFRAFSTFVAPGTFAGNMGLLALLAYSVLSSSSVAFRWRLTAGGAFAVMSAGIAASGSRGPVAHLLLAAVALLAIVPGVSSKVKLIIRVVVLSSVALLVVTLMVGPVVGERYSTIFDPDSFFWKWFGPLTGGLGVALRYPFGMGLGYTAGVPQFIHDRFFQDLPTTNIDSGYGAAAAELGLVGLLLFVYLAARVGFDGLRAWKALPPGRMKDLFLGPMLMAVTYPIVSVIFQPQAGLPSSIYFWLLMGMLISASTLPEGTSADSILRAEVHSRE